MSRMLAELLTDAPAMEVFAAAIHDRRAWALGRKTMWPDQTEEVRRSFLVRIPIAVRLALASQVSPLAREPLPNPPELGLVLCEEMQRAFPAPRFKSGDSMKPGLQRRKAFNREAAELRDLWRPAVIAGLEAYAAFVRSRIGADIPAPTLPGLPERTAA